MTVAEASKSPWGPIRRKRGSQFPAKREAVLAAAAALMRRHGYKGTSLADLAEILNITKPTLYYYVGSKEELFSEIVNRAQQETLDFIRIVVAQEMTGFEKLQKVMIKYAEIVSSDFGACLLLPRPTYVEAGVHLELKSREREANELIYKILMEGQRDGTLRVPDPTVVLHTIFGSLNWIPRWYKAGGRMSLRKLAEMQVDILLNGMRGAVVQPGASSKTPAGARRRG